MPWEDDREDAVPGGEPQEEADIQSLLDAGYEQLDGFVIWLEETLGLDTRTGQQDCFNAESLLDYLANHQRKSAEAINEFELRWFLFSHYIRKAMADPETEERLPDSLRRFFEYLRAEHGYEVPEWLYSTLDDRAFYMKRLRAYADLNSEDEAEWQEGFTEWCQELEDDLDLRCLWLPRELAEGMRWEDGMGWREATLQEEANRIWQEERAELLRDGLDFERARLHLLQNYLLWLATPQERLEDRTPLEVIWEERRESVEEAEEGKEA